jgi:hypothetical protein
VDHPLSGRTRGAAIRLHADRVHGVVLRGEAPLEVRGRSGGWRAVEDLARGHVPTPGVYRVGEALWFRIDL